MRTIFPTFFTSALLYGAALLSIQAAAPATPQGFVTWRLFRGIGGTAVSDLTNNAAFPNSPSAVFYEPYFEAWATGDINTPAPGSNEDNYGSQMVGYFYPPTTGDYTFYICSDDNSALYLSSDDSPSNKKLIAVESVWSNPREYTTSGGGSVLASKDSATYASTEWPTKDTANGGAKITLTAGKAYYIEALQKEGGGGDDLSVSIDGSLPIPGTSLSTLDKTSGPVSITTQPASLTTNENQAVSFEVVADGTPPYTYQWSLNGTPIQDATNNVFSLSRVPASYNGGKLTVTVTGAQGTATSSPATITIKADTVAPTLVSAHAGGSNNVAVAYSKPIDPTTGTNAANYVINGVAVTSAVLGAQPNDNLVFLNTANQTPGQTYTLTVNGVKDISAAGNVIAASTKVTFPAVQLLPGMAQRYFSAFTSGTPEDLLTDPRYPISPTFATSEPEMEYPPFSGPFVYPAVNNNEAGDSYGNELSGYVIPPITGNYVFFLCSDDHSSLYLSTDDNPANKQLIAAESVWSNPRQWLTSGGASDLAQKRSDQNPNTTWATRDAANGGATITLTAGKKYYLQAIHQEGGGGDNLEVTWQLPGGKAVADNDPPISALDLLAYVDPSAAPKITVTTPPANITIPEGRKANLSAAFSVGTNSAPAYARWQVEPAGSSTFTNIVASTGKSKLTTPILAQADSGIKYQLVIASVGTNVIAGPATVTVVPDTFPPVATVGAVSHDGAIQIGVSFDKSVSAASAGVAANYSISGGTITAATVITNNPADVTLDTTGLSVGGTYTLTIKNISDTLAKPNTLASTNITFTVPATQWASIGAPTIPAAVTAVGTNGFDVVSGGLQFWGTYDEVTFVYVPKTNDFDVAVQVIEQDPASKWARGGLMVREATDEGKTQADSDPTAANPYLFSAYREIHADPPDTTGDQNQGSNNSFEANARVGSKYGAADNTTTGWNTGPSVLPNYPDVWLRLARKANHISGYYSNDGAETWVDFAESDWPNAPSVLLVGPGYSPENVNAWADVSNYRSYMIQYRNFGDFTTSTNGGGGTGNGQFTSIAKSGNKITIAWTGTATLQSAPDVTGPWTTVANATSPQTVQPTSTRQFFRLQ